MNTSGVLSLVAALALMCACGAADTEHHSLMPVVATAAADAPVTLQLSENDMSQGSMGPRQPASVGPANPNATADAKAVLAGFTALRHNGGQQVLSGQNIGHIEYKLAEGFEKFYRALETSTGSAPSILALDYGYEPPTTVNMRRANQYLLDHCQRGGIISISLHPKNPFTGNNVDDRQTGGKPFSDILTKGSETHQRWMATLAAVADGLEELRDTNVTVLWRPLHEMNGKWFWWTVNADGDFVTPEEFTALWREMFVYFTETRDLDNLLWVYAPNVQVDPDLMPSDFYYPGDDYVDIVGLDYYRNSLDELNAGGSYDRLAAIDKPMGLAEVGPANWAKAHPNGRYDTTQVIRAIETDYPKISFFTFWHGWQTGFRRARSAIIENQNADELMSHENVATLGDMPALFRPHSCQQ